ncbi:MAG: CehA/McbA family metallohydrolase [Anaerolineaceae bacterium]
MKEITCNIHIHTTYSDGFGTYSSISAAAASANLDVIILTDHNIWVKGLEGYYTNAGRQVLVLTGEEVHNQNRLPQKNHLLVLGAEAEMATYAFDPQTLISTISKHGGLSFLAHPDEMNLPIVNEDDISWVDWNIDGFSGFELWNHFSELKTVSRSTFQLLLNVFFPNRIATSPAQATLDRWDHLLSEGKHLSVIGGADAHAQIHHLGPITKTIFPYFFHFSSINNHLLLPEPLSGDLLQDKAMVYRALGKGSSYIGYDKPASTYGFSFTISDENVTANLGESIVLTKDTMAHIHLPHPALVRLLNNGIEICHKTVSDQLTFPLIEPGAYRVECFINYLGKKRGWIYSNPIYVENRD